MEKGESFTEWSTAQSLEPVHRIHTDETQKVTKKHMYKEKDHSLIRIHHEKSHSHPAHACLPACLPKGESSCLSVAHRECWNADVKRCRYPLKCYASFPLSLCQRWYQCLGECKQENPKTSSNLKASAATRQTIRRWSLITPLGPWYLCHLDRA